MGFHAPDFLDSENTGFTAAGRRWLWKMSQEPQNSASNDVKISGKNDFGEAGGTPGEPEIAGENEDSGQPSYKPILGFSQARSHCVISYRCWPLPNFYN